LINKIKGILNVLSSLLILLGIILLVPISVAFIQKEAMISYYSFVVPSIISFALGGTFHFFTKENKPMITLTTSMIICALAWIVISIIGAIPFMINLEKGFIDSFFEAVSGLQQLELQSFKA